MVVSMVSLFSDLFTTKWNDNDLRKGGEIEILCVNGNTEARSKM